MTLQWSAIPDTPPKAAKPPRRRVHKYTKPSVWDRLDESALACLVIGGVFGLLMGKWLVWCFVIGQMRLGR